MDPGTKKLADDKSFEPESEAEAPARQGARVKPLIDRIQHVLDAPEAAPPRSVRRASPAQQPAVGGRSTPARHQLPPIASPACVRHGVPPYVPVARGLVPTMVYHPTAKTKHTKLHFYPGTLIPVVHKRPTAPSAAAGCPPSESRREPPRDERSPSRCDRRDEPSRSRRASPWNRRMSTPSQSHRPRREHWKSPSSRRRNRR